MASGALIYHYPLGLGVENSGSQVHILQMLAAFRALGYEVEPVIGIAAERGRTLRRLAGEVARGRRFDFVYAWSPNAPTLLVKRNLLHPFSDLDFWRWCRSQGFPSGVFYGDVHWRFDHYRRNVPWPVRARSIPFYYYDWLQYRRYADHLFLPSLKMAAFTPTRWPAERMSALLPGCNVRSLAAHSPAADGELHLLYVGGVTPPLYELKPMLDALESLEGVSLTLCCRPAEWAKVHHHYGPLHDKPVRIVHAAGEELARHYGIADVFGLFWRHPYLEITMPVKVIEALGFGLPIIAASGTTAASFVLQEGVGWAVASANDFRDLLVSLRDHPQAIVEKRRRAETVRLRHTWQVRAQQIAGTLARYDRRPRG